MAGGKCGALYMQKGCGTLRRDAAIIRIPGFIIVIIQNQDCMIKCSHKLSEALKCIEFKSTGTSK